jgi:hypothetical protein
MTALPVARPCRYCVANWAGATKSIDLPPITPTPTDCETTHRDDPRIYDLATAMARVCQQRNPTDEQISRFLADADDVVDDFDPAPARWRIRRLPDTDEDSIDMRLRINDVTYVCLEGGKDFRGSVVRLSTYRSWDAG